MGSRTTKHDKTNIEENSKYVVVGICTYNNEDTIERTLYSLENQLRRPDEIVICDKSSDGTLSKIKNFQKKSKMKITILRQKGDGVGEARNEILNYLKREAKCDLLFFLDTDITIPPDFITKSLKLHEMYPDVGVVCPGERFTIAQDPFQGDYFCQGTCSIKFDLIKELNLEYDSTLKRGEDWDFAIKLFKNGVTSLITPELKRDVFEKVTFKTWIKKNLKRPTSLPYIKKYGIWYIRKHPVHFFGDLVSFILLISVALSVVGFIAQISEFKTLLFASMFTYVLYFAGMRYKYKKLYLGNIHYIVIHTLWPIIYGITVLKYIFFSIIKYIYSLSAIIDWLKLTSLRKN